MTDIAKKLREVEFTLEIRGYNKDEVDDFLEQCANEVEVLENQIVDHRQKLDALSEELNSLRSAPKEQESTPDEVALTETMSKALLLAQRTADSVVEDAKNRARELLEKAQLEANRLENEARKKVESEVAKLKESKEAILKDISELHLIITKEREELLNGLTRIGDWVRGHLNSEKLKSLVNDAQGSLSSADPKDASRIFPNNK